MLSIFLAYELPPEQKLHESIEFVLTFANPSLERGRLYSFIGRATHIFGNGWFTTFFMVMEKYLLSKLQIILHWFFTAACI